MPGSNRTVLKFSAVSWGTGGGVQHLIPWSIGPGLDVAGISTSEDVTYPIAGPYPNLDYVSEGLIDVTGASFTVGAIVYLDANGLLTQGLTGQAAIHPTSSVRVGHAINGTQVMVTLRAPVGRSSANVRPVVVSDTNPSAHQATDAEMTALGLTP